MYGGLIRKTGTIKKVDLSKGDIVINAPAITRYLKRGDSISVDGICLTVVRKSKSGFLVNVTRETVRRTHLSGIKSGTVVNLERPLRMSDYLHGHLIQGHVDGVGVIQSINPTKVTKKSSSAVGVEMNVKIPAKLKKYAKEKGSIAINGVSLTIASCHGNIVGLALIPETLKRTNLGDLRKGSKVTVEIDLIARYLLG